MTGAPLAVVLVGGSIALLFVGLAVMAMMRPRSRQISMTTDNDSGEESNDG
ncbi:hypothetical protein [Reticulibacter mediterranei]|uniref:hypothetical protein n=1 Tax=Reticulibacter mediterranei TaxID=2778369 RepID=UPI001C688120|nr:hypothetical protein [Reticulibacter mediterranei]